MLQRSPSSPAAKETELAGDTTRVRKSRELSDQKQEQGDHTFRSKRKFARISTRSAEPPLAHLRDFAYPPVSRSLARILATVSAIEEASVSLDQPLANQLLSGRPLDNVRVKARVMLTDGTAQARGLVHSVDLFARLCGAGAYTNHIHRMVELVRNIPDQVVRYVREPSMDRRTTPISEEERLLSELCTTGWSPCIRHEIYVRYFPAWKKSLTPWFYTNASSATAPTSEDWEEALRPRKLMKVGRTQLNVVSIPTIWLKIVDVRQPPTVASYACEMANDLEKLLEQNSS